MSEFTYWPDVDKRIAKESKKRKIAPRILYDWYGRGVEPENLTIKVEDGAAMFAADGDDVVLSRVEPKKVKGEQIQRLHGWNPGEICYSRLPKQDGTYIYIKTEIVDESKVPGRLKAK